MASISQFISITSLIQGGVTGATRVAFYGPVATGDMKKASVVYKTSQSFYTKFALALSGYVAVLAVVYPKFVETPFSYIDALLLVLVLGMNAIFESMFGIPKHPPAGVLCKSYMVRWRASFLPFFTLFALFAHFAPQKPQSEPSFYLL